MILDLAVYHDGQRQEGDLELDSAFEAGREPNSFVWIGLHEPTLNELHAIGAEFELHELAIEDAIHAHQRPKVERYGNSLFVVLKAARYVDEAETVTFAEVQAFIGPSFVVTVQHGGASSFTDIRQHLEARADLLRLGPYAVLYGLIDHAIDGYQPAADGIDNDLSEVTSEVFSNSRLNPSERIFSLKRQVLEFQRNTEPLAEALAGLRAEGTTVAHSDLKNYFRDAEDHLLRTLARLHAYSTLLTDALGANIANITVRQNNDMRTISAWVAIAAIPTMIAAIYGMNFEHMPELEQPWGYPLILAAMIALCTVAYRRFKRVGWL